MARKRKQVSTSDKPEDGENPDRKKHKNDKDAFHAGLLTAIRTAWENRDIEGTLYPVWNRISEMVCTVVDPGPHKTMFTEPQYPLKKSRIGKESSDASAEGGEEDEWPVRIPDYARLVDEDHRAQGITTGPMTSQTLIDMTEIKPLSDNEPWGTEAARNVAGGMISDCLFQVYSTAMAAFCRNPKWMHVYVTVMIGIYYTQLHWKRPKTAILEPHHFKAMKAIPHTRMTQEEHENLISRITASIEETKGRKMPEILCWNEPMVSFGEGCDVTSVEAKVQLTRPFLWSLRQPMKHHRKTTYDTCWMSAPREKPQEIPAGVTDAADELVHRELVAIPVLSLERHLEVLRGTPTVTPAVSQATSGEGRDTDSDFSPPPQNGSADQPPASISARVTRSSMLLRALHAAAPNVPVPNEAAATTSAAGTIPQTAAPAHEAQDNETVGVLRFAGVLRSAKRVKRAQ